MQKPKPKPKMLEFELEGQIKRWTIRQENVGGLWFGIFLVLFPVPHFSISLYGLITSAFGPRTESVDLFEVSWLAITLVFSSLFMVIGLKLIWRDILSRNSGLKTVVELTPTKLSCRNPVLNEVAAAVNVDLDLIRQLILLESLEDLEDKENDAVKNDLKSQNEKAAIVVRGPQTNCTLIQGFPHYLLQMLASQLVIAITKMQHQLQLQEIKQGVKPQPVVDVKLFQEEPGLRIPPGDTQFTLAQSGKNKTYLFQPNVFPSVIIAVIGFIGACVFGGLMCHAFWVEGNIIHLVLWSLPMLTCSALALFMLDSSRRWVKITTSPSELIVEHAVLFGRKNSRLPKSEIDSVRVIVDNPLAYSFRADAVAPTYQIAVIRVNGQVFEVPSDGIDKRDLQWLAMELDNAHDFLPKAILSTNHPIDLDRSRFASQMH